MNYFVQEKPYFNISHAHIDKGVGELFFLFLVSLPTRLKQTHTTSFLFIVYHIYSSM